MSSASENLRRLFTDRTGIDGSMLSKTDIQKLKLDSDVVQRIMECLSSNEQADISTGFLFLNSLLEINQPAEFGNEFYSFLIERLNELKEHSSKYVCYQALELYVWLRGNYSDYRNVMKGFLHSHDLGFRRIALHNYETYAEDNEISPLVHFSNDGYTAEKGMNSDLFYELRDLALEKIEIITGNSFCCSRLNEPCDGTVVSWYDWSNFFKWWEKEKTNYL